MFYDEKELNVETIQENTKIKAEYFWNLRCPGLVPWLNEQGVTLEQIVQHHQELLTLVAVDTTETWQNKNFQFKLNIDEQKQLQDLQSELDELAEDRGEPFPSESNADRRIKDLSSEIKKLELIKERQSIISGLKKKRLNPSEKKEMKELEAESRELRLAVLQHEFTSRQSKFLREKVRAQTANFPLSLSIENRTSQQIETLDNERKILKQNKTLQHEIEALRSQPLQNELNQIFRRFGNQEFSLEDVNTLRIDVIDLGSVMYAPFLKADDVFNRSVQERNEKVIQQKEHPKVKELNETYKLFLVQEQIPIVWSTEKQRREPWDEKQQKMLDIEKRKAAYFLITNHINPQQYALRDSQQDALIQASQTDNKDMFLKGLKNYAESELKFVAENLMWTQKLLQLSSEERPICQKSLTQLISDSLELIVQLRSNVDQLNTLTNGEGIQQLQTKICDFVESTNRKIKERYLKNHDALLSEISLSEETFVALERNVLLDQKKVKQTKIVNQIEIGATKEYKEIGISIQNAPEKIKKQKNDNMTQEREDRKKITENDAEIKMLEKENTTVVEQKNQGTERISENDEKIQQLKQDNRNKTMNIEVRQQEIVDMENDYKENWPQQRRALQEDFITIASGIQNTLKERNLDYLDEKQWNPVFYKKFKGLESESQSLSATTKWSVKVGKIRKFYETLKDIPQSSKDLHRILQECCSQEISLEEAKHFHRELLLNGIVNDDLRSLIQTHLHHSDGIKLSKITITHNLIDQLNEMVNQSGLDQKQTAAQIQHIKQFLIRHFGFRPGFSASLSIGGEALDQWLSNRMTITQPVQIAHVGPVGAPLPEMKEVRIDDRAVKGPAGPPVPEMPDDAQPVIEKIQVEQKIERPTLLKRLLGWVTGQKLETSSTEAICDGLEYPPRAVAKKLGKETKEQEQREARKIQEQSHDKVKPRSNAVLPDSLKEKRSKMPAGPPEAHRKRGKIAG